MKLAIIKFFIYCFFAVASGGGFCQITIVNKNVTITNSQTSIYINGDFVNQSIGRIDNGGIIYFRSNVENNSDNGMLPSSSGKVIFDGEGDQHVFGSSSIHFFKLELDKPSGMLKLDQGIEIEDTLLMVNGNIDIGEKDIDLNEDGVLINESEDHFVFGSNGVIKAQRFVDHPTLSENIAGLGLYISSQEHLGYVQLKRGHKQQISYGDTSIFRYFDFVPLSNSITLIDSLKFSYFNGESIDGEDLYKIYTSSDDGINWNNRGGLVDSESNMVVSTTVCPPAIGKFRASLFPSDNFATCLPNDPNYLSAVFLVSSSVIDGDSIKFIQLGNKSFSDISWDFGDGMASKEYNPLHTYHLENSEKTDRYQVTMTVSNNKCSDTRRKYVVVDPMLNSPKNESLYNGIEYYTLFPTVNSGSFILEIKLKELSKISVSISDMQGRVVDVKNIQSAHYMEELDYGSLASGMYVVRLQVGEEIRTMKIVKY